MEKKSVLVIDDDHDVLDLVSAILEREGYSVELAATEDEVLERLTGGGRFDLIVTDVWMPWMSGLQVAHFAEIAGHTTPVLFMSGFADPSLEQRVQIFGEHARLLRKPFDDVTLLGAIDDLLHLDERQRTKKAFTSSSASSRSGS
jgi:CheY-like chemotaxis protein